MKKPTSNGKDLYQVGNDYPQIPEKYFNTSAYADGIYTELKEPFNAVTDGSDASGDVFFDMKRPDGINKRILAVLPQSGWAPVEASGFEGEAIFSDDYATANVVSGLGEEV